MITPEEHISELQDRILKLREVLRKFNAGLSKREARIQTLRTALQTVMSDLVRKGIDIDTPEWGWVQEVLKKTSGPFPEIELPPSQEG
jgi:chromosome segregation ATPase